MWRCTVRIAWELNLLCHAPGRANGAGALCKCLGILLPDPDAFGVPVKPSLKFADRDQLATPKANKPHVRLDMRAPGVPGHAQRFARLLDAQREGKGAPFLGGKGRGRMWRYWGHFSHKNPPCPDRPSSVWITAGRRAPLATSQLTEPRKPR